MMSTYCLGGDEVRQFIERAVYDRAVADAELARVLEDAESWMTEITLHTYLVCVALEGQRADVTESARVVTCLYELDSEMLIRFQELDRDFLAYMLLQPRRRRELSLVDELVDLQRRLGEYRYDRRMGSGNETLRN